jgi:Domain of Unknown Function (DUF349)
MLAVSSTESTGDQTSQATPVEEAPSTQTPQGAGSDAPTGDATGAETTTETTSETTSSETTSSEPAGAAPSSAADAGDLAAAAAAGDLPTAEPRGAEAPEAGGEPDGEAAPEATDQPVSEAAPEAGGETAGERNREAAPEATGQPDGGSTPAPSTDAVPASVGELPAAPPPGPRPHAPKHAPTSSPAPASAGAAGPSPAAETAPAEPASDPSRWGRVDEEGTVYVRTATGERAVGSWQAGDPAAGLAHYGRRYDDLATEVSLLEARLAAKTGNPQEIRAKAQALADSVPTADVVGDLPGLAARLGTIINTAEAAAAVSRAEKAAARAAQVQRKETLAAEAEQIAADSTQWKAAGDRLKAIVEEWKTIKGIDRKTDDALWQRFAAARDAFGRRRGAHFASLDAQRAESRAAKTALIEEAERLSRSTEWGPTSAAMRTLMDRWKAVPRTGRDTDDDLWKRFRAAQDVFFAARTANDQARSSEEQANQRQKEELLAEAERIDPTKDLRGAQNALRKIQERYDAIGHVPRGAMRQLEDRMRAVEEKVRGAVDSSRPRTAPENPLLTSMRAAVAKAEDQLAKAEASGDARRISEARANVATRREWLAEAEKSSGRR